MSSAPNKSNSEAKRSDSRIRATLQAYDEKLLAELAWLRKRFAHSGNKGSGAERVLRELLRKHLPRRLEIGHGEIIDRAERCSGDCDLIIIDDTHPHLPEPEEPGMFFIEGVAAGGEVKSFLTTAQLKKACEKARQFKRLGTTGPESQRIWFTESNRKRFHIRPPFFVFAFESRLSLETIGERVLAESKEAEAAGEQMFDAIFILNKGCGIDLGDGKGSFRFPAPGGGFQKGWIFFREPFSCLQLLTWLTDVLPVNMGGRAVIHSYLAQVPKQEPSKPEE
jgi:hypothetical protein